MTGVLIRRGTLGEKRKKHAEGRQCKDIGRKCSSTSQGEKPGTDHSPITLRRNQPCGYLDLRLPVSETIRKLISVV